MASSEKHIEAKTILVFAVIALAAVALAWFIFAPKSEDYETTGNGSTTSPVTANGTFYSNQDMAFSVTVPVGFTVDESYINQNLGPGREIPGIAFKIPASVAAGTNLSADSKVSVEELSDVDCMPADFLYQPRSSAPVAIGSNRFIVATSADAGAGNIYEETVYVTERGSRCYAVRYFIHYGNIGNYPAGAVKEFDRAALVRSFDAITASLRLI
ncbi:MAG TPA: hypothetical protein VHE10_03040 [Candidatus Paceibacterota bacterium]|nr:hypothetical protein [Candidatus Paceibacterota bacterium]